MKKKRFVSYVYVYVDVDVCVWWWTQLIRILEFLSVSLAYCLEQVNATMSESPNNSNFARGLTIINPREREREREIFGKTIKVEENFLGFVLFCAFYKEKKKKKEEEEEEEKF